MTGLKFDDLVVITRGTTWLPLRQAMEKYGVIVYKGHKKYRILPLDKLHVVKEMVQQTTSYNSLKPLWDDEIEQQMINPL
ncbi:MAG: hypothetical protein ACP5G8_04700, partial [Athalassotoga sp.]